MEVGRRAGAGRPSAHRDVHRPFVHHGSILFVSDVMRWFFKPNPPFRCLSSHPSHPRSLSPSFQVRQLSPFGATHALARAGCAVRRRPWPPWPPSRQPAPWFCALHGSQSLGWLPRMDRPRPQTTMTMMTISDHSNSNVTIARLYLSSGRDNNREREAAGNDKIKCESGPEESF